MVILYNFTIFKIAKKIKKIIKLKGAPDSRGNKIVSKFKKSNKLNPKKDHANTTEKNVGNKAIFLKGSLPFCRIQWINCMRSR